VSVKMGKKPDELFDNKYELNQIREKVQKIKRLRREIKTLQQRYREKNGVELKDDSLREKIRGNLTSISLKSPEPLTAPLKKLLGVSSDD